jgi:hypothetical protein
MQERLEGDRGGCRCRFCECLVFAAALAGVPARLSPVTGERFQRATVERCRPGGAAGDMGVDKSSTLSFVSTPDDSGQRPRTCRRRPRHGGGEGSRRRVVNPVK